jgi:hypothetical protein
MKRPQRLLWSLGLSALVGFMGSEVRAGSIVMDVDLGGTVIFSVSSAAPDTSITLTTNEFTALNNALQNAGSAYRFTSLGAISNFTGSATGFLQVNGQVKVVATGSTTPTLSIDATQSGYLAPVGPNGTVTAAAGGNYAGGAVGSTSYTGDYQGVLTPTLSFPTTGGTSYSGSTGAIPVGTVPSGYEISDHVIVNLNQIVGSGDGFTGTTTVTAMVIPEPASIVTLLTGMPVPFVLLGLVRLRRKAKAIG